MKYSLIVVDILRERRFSAIGMTAFGLTSKDYLRVFEYIALNVIKILDVIKNYLRRFDYVAFSSHSWGCRNLRLIMTNTNQSNTWGTLRTTGLGICGTNIVLVSSILAIKASGTL